MFGNMLWNILYFEHNLIKLLQSKHWMYVYNQIIFEVKTIQDGHHSYSNQLLFMSRFD